MKTIFWTYRPERIMSAYSLDGGVTLNGIYTCGFFLSNQFWDWERAGLTRILDSEIPESNYIGEVVPWVPKLTRLVVCEYNEQYVDPVEFSRSITNVWARFNIEIFANSSDAIDWIKANTDLVELNPGVFQINGEHTSPTGEIFPQKLLTIA